VGSNPGWSYPNGAGGNTFHGQTRRTEPESSTLGRFPANFIWSCNEDEYKYNGLESDLLEIQQILWE